MDGYESYVSLKTAKMLKGAGFDWRCHCGFDAKDKECYAFNSSINWNDGTTKCCSQPTLETAQRWLRGVHAINIDIKSTITGKFGFEAHFISEAVRQAKGFNNGWLALSSCMFNTYEEALEIGIQNCLTVLLKK